jgi:hypothetical protein
MLIALHPFGADQQNVEGRKPIWERVPESDQHDQHDQHFKKRVLSFFKKRKKERIIGWPLPK